MISRLRRGAVAVAAALSMVAGLVFVSAPPALASSPGEVWTARSAAEANQWNSVSYGNGLFVAVAQSGTNRVMTSPDGVTWTGRTAASASQWTSVTYGNGTFVAVGYTGALMTSTDGVTWTGRTAAEAANWTSVTYGNGTFVAVATTGTNRVMTSTDGVTWTGRTAAEANGWASVTYGNSKFVAVSGTGTNRVMTSSDGVTWTARSAAEANAWQAVTFGGGVFVGVSSDGTNRVMTSSDGVTWTARSATEANSWFRVTYGSGTFVAVAFSGTNRVMTSSDGVTWTARSATEANSWRSVTYGDEMFVAVSNNGTNRVMTSMTASAPDAPTLLVATPGDGSASISFTAGADGGRAITKYQYTTDDGSTWTDAVGTTSPVTLSGLTNGTNYSIKLRAVNSVGDGVKSSTAVSVTPVSPVSVPAAPTSLVATAGDGSASIAFTAGSDGGAEIMNYRYSIDDGATWLAFPQMVMSSPVTIPGLTNFTTYNVKLRAVNSAGDGAASSSVSVTPVVAGPTSCSATALSDRSIQACWNPFTPSQGALIKVRARVFFAGTNTILRACVAQASATSCVAGGLKANTTYDVRVLGRIRIAPHQVFWTSYGTTQQVTTLP